MTEAPLEYRGCVIHLGIAGGCFTVMAPLHKLEAETWDELKTKIDEELHNV